MSFLATSLVLATFLSYAAGIPAPSVLLPRQDAAIAALPKAQITAFKPFTYFAAAGYCTPAQTAKWNCGGVLYTKCLEIEAFLIREEHSATCKANKDFVPIASGGDGSTVQYCKYICHYEHHFNLLRVCI